MPTAAPANDVDICRPVNEKKRKEDSAAANDEGGPPKKKYKKRYCKAEGCDKWAQGGGGVCRKHGGKKKLCRVEGCTNKVQVGGVCIRHGGKVKLCSSEGCTNQAVREGVCIRHGATWTKKRCSIDGCAKFAQNGGVCIRHGATWTKKRCSIDDCTNQVVKGGVCKRHGAKVKLCSSEGCTNQAKKGGVCSNHGANLVITPSTKARGENRSNKHQEIQQQQPQEQQQQQQQQQQEQQHNYMGSTSRFTSLDHHPFLQQWNDHYNYHNHSFINPNWACGHHPYYGFEGRNMASMQGEFLRGREESSIAAQANNQRDRIQEGGNQHDVVALIEESDNEDEEEGGKKQSPDAGQKLKADVSKHQSATSTSNDTGDDGLEGMNDQITGNKGTDKDSQNGIAELSSLGKDDNEQSKSDTILQKRANEGANPKYDSEQDASDVTLMMGGEGVTGDATEDRDMCGGDDHNECDFGGEDERDVQAAKDADDANLEEMTMKPEAEKADPNSQVEASSRQSNELKNQVEDLSAEITALKTELEEAVRKDAELSAKLAEVTKNYEASKQLFKSKEAELARKEAELQTSAVELKKMATDVATLNAKLTMGAQNEAALRNRIDDFASERNRFKSMQNQQQSMIKELGDELKERLVELKEKDKTIAELKRKEQISVNELKEAKTSLEEANSRNVLLTKQLGDIKHELMLKEDAMAKEETERKRLQSSIDAAKQDYVATIQDMKFQLKTKSDTVEKLNSALVEVKASKAEVESQLQLKTTELQEMTGKVSDAEERVKSVREKLTQELQTKQNQLSANVENMKSQQEDALKKEEALMDQLKRLQSQMEILQDSKIELEQEKATNDTLLRKWQNEANEKSKTAERLSEDLNSKEAAMKEMSTEVAALNSKLAEHARGSDNAKILTEIGALKEALSKQEETSVIAMKKIKELEESAKKSPKRVQPPRRNKSSLETLDFEEQSQPRNSNRGSSIPCDEDDAHLVQMIGNEIVDNAEEVSFTDIAGLKDEKEAIQENVIFPLFRPDLCKGLRACPKGLLLFGPPGTGKTMIGKAIAHESKATFFSISASSLASKWVGEGEKLVKYLFVEASSRAPSVVFIDEVDSLLSQRKMNEEEGSRKAKTEFLVQLDGVGKTSSGILFIGATNCPQDLDDAVRRRFETRLYIPLPDQHGREALLRHALSENSHSLSDIDFASLSRDTEGFSGADMQILCKRAGRAPLRSLLRKKNMMDIEANELPPISYEHFRQSLSCMNPSVSSDDLQMYIDWNDAHGSG